MLHLQRASAGSGKTYTLTKHFIFHLIARKVKETGEYHLRNEADIEDAARHVLAITFTNKATNEMKSRIVKNLSELANKYDGRKPNYLEDFARSLNVTEEQIQRACFVALEALLNDYTDFNVQTIDSFFQSVLRTFAYEIDISDNYQVEIDNDYVAQVGIDATLNLVSAREPDKETTYWIEKLMADAVKKGTSWNVFGKSLAKQSIYANLIEMWKHLEKEGYKRVAPEMKEYFSKYPDYRETFAALNSAFLQKAEEAAGKTKDAAGKLMEIIKREDLESSHFVNRAYSHIEKVLANTDTGNAPIFAFTTELKSLSEPNGIMRKKSSRLGETALVEELREAGIEFYSGYRLWREALLKKEVKLWLRYRENMLYLGLMNTISNYSKRVLEENNLIDISETNSLLSRIIGDDDAPFIYERIGGRLDHFLIDEFQDTSAMQWENLRPLLRESEARHEDNLIIGDAKQSIYRFRNADSSLITTTVPNEFPTHVAAGYTKQENSNHRSSQRIVEFNNLLFHRIVEYLDNKEYTINFKDLYSNVVQYPARQNAHGYVELRFVDKPADDAEPAEEFDAMGPLVSSLLAKGYRQKDIAFLVAENADGQHLIDALIDYNANLKPGETPISFISQQSLLISRSVAVKTIVSVLEKISKGEETKNESDPDVDEALKQFLDTAEGYDSISDMLAQLQAVTITSLIEAIAHRFVSERLRNSDAAYIAAFQDAAIDYCESHPADLASFLAWWEKQKEKLSVTSPKDTDAVQIMTIHKAKGLEFKCVILPSLTTSIGASTHHPEWLWVKPAIDSPIDTPMPPYIPITLNNNLIGTPYEQDLREQQAAKTMDKLNQLYVAFTRPIEQLYVFMPVTKWEPALSDAIAGLIYYLLPSTPASTYLAENYKDENLACQNLFRYIPEQRLITFGTDTGPYKNENEEKKRKTPVMEVKSYTVTETHPILLYKEDEVPAAADPDDDDDPRSEGNIMHSIMAMTRTPADLYRATLKHYVRGLITDERRREILSFLTKELEREEVAEWFKPELRVVAERSILQTGKETKRPDRIVVTPDGRAIVIDYKFGFLTDEQYNSKKGVHRRQVAEYMRLLEATGRFKSVEGYLWYVYRNKIDKIHNA